jgi:LDH2 family malate/lactate/ureidoglycolate dehydrogenase
MDRAIGIAKGHGISLVGVRHSNHFGAAGYYVQMAAERGLIGVAFSNSVPHVAAYGGISAVLGTNPFAFGAPTREGRSVLVDFSTGARSGSVIMHAAREGAMIPEGIVVDENGDPVVDAQKAVDGVILPFGGAKGFGLGLMIEILSAVVTGAGISLEVASLHRDMERESNVGHCFIAIDVSRLMPLDLYYDRMDMLIGFVKESRPQRGVEEVLIPGETRWRIAEGHLAQGIYLDAGAIEALESMAQDWGVSTPW